MAQRDGTPRVSLYAAPELGRYGYVEKAWFQPDVRLRSLLDELERRDLLGAVAHSHAPPATREQLMLLHTPDHVDRVRERCARDEGSLDHGPTLARRHVEVAARHVVGAVLHAARALLEGQTRSAFVPIAGFHHALRDEARMYCLYNDPAIVLQWLLGQLEGNLAYIDIDVHRGDGVYTLFESEPRVVIADLHEHPRTLFPHSPSAPGPVSASGPEALRGVGPARGSKLNVPLPPGTDDDAYLERWEEAEAFIRRAAPRFVVLVSGVDGLEGDPLSHQCLSPRVIGEVTRRARAIADESAEGRLLVLGGGGYDLENVAAGWSAVVEALLS